MPIMIFYFAVREEKPRNHESFFPRKLKVVIYQVVYQLKQSLLEMFYLTPKCLCIYIGGCTGGGEGVLILEENNSVACLFWSGLNSIFH